MFAFGLAPSNGPPRIESSQVDGAKPLFIRAPQSGLVPSNVGWRQADFDGFKRDVLVIQLSDLDNGLGQNTLGVKERSSPMSSLL